MGFVDECNEMGAEGKVCMYLGNKICSLGRLNMYIIQNQFFLIVKVMFVIRI